MQDNVLEIIKSRLENESEMAFSSFEEYAELHGYNETEDYFSFGVKRAIKIINEYIRLEKDEKNEENKSKRTRSKKMYKDMNDVIKELENIKGVCFSLLENNPDKSILLNNMYALNIAIQIISDNHKNHTIEAVRKKLEEEEQLEKLKKDIFRGV